MQSHTAYNYIAKNLENKHLRFIKFVLGVGWSGPPSFLSNSSGPSSPGISDPYSNSKESSEMSSSIVSNEG